MCAAKCNWADMRNLENLWKGAVVIVMIRKLTVDYPVSGKNKKITNEQTIMPVNTEMVSTFSPTTWKHQYMSCLKKQSNYVTNF